MKLILFFIISTCFSKSQEYKLTCFNFHIADVKQTIYETGKIKKNEPGPVDLKIMCDFIKSIKPHQIYAAGDLEDVNKNAYNRGEQGRVASNAIRILQVLWLLEH